MQQNLNCMGIYFFFVFAITIFHISLVSILLQKNLIIYIFFFFFFAQKKVHILINKRISKKKLQKSLLKLTPILCYSSSFASCYLPCSNCNIVINTEISFFFLKKACGMQNNWLQFKIFLSIFKFFPFNQLQRQKSAADKLSCIYSC